MVCLELFKPVRQAGSDRLVQEEIKIFESKILIGEKVIFSLSSFVGLC